ncbi:hypothetical protein IW15_10545 [Chryseobacterium soli]|uniref:DUF4349 domain-containing protein n=1 Tax=Chryseobacterium soli TaxID=445961 RepID=A0A086A919_9FLAO|nr:DUF4349 domain-containing protein [Chryseobacterium soli]KFF13183.1 hypothetical protein IW15_10545 [Chryseobacterium soli]
MKKIILLIAVSSTFIMCKKSEAVQSQMENAADSAVSETINSVQANADKVLDSANIKIKDFENAKGEIQQNIENTSKIVDSLSTKIASTKLESKIEKKDSSEKKREKIVVNVPAPKVIKETKIIYKDSPKNDSYELSAPKNKMVKNGYISITADNAETVKEIIKEEAAKNNAYIKSEQLSYTTPEPVKNTPPSYPEDHQKVYDLQIKVPIQNFEGLMNSLSSSISDIESKNIEVTGTQYVDNTICTVAVTLIDTTESNQKPDTFGGKSLAAISSGWNVITSIFLFILPLWPLFLIAGIGYYLYNKKNKNLPDNNSK